MVLSSGGAKVFEGIVGTTLGLSTYSFGGAFLPTVFNILISTLLVVPANALIVSSGPKLVPKVSSEASGPGESRARPALFSLIFGDLAMLVWGEY